MTGQEFNSTHRPKARTSHQCEECGRTIDPGERYERTAAVWEGDFFTNIACQHCAVARVLVDEVDGYYNEGYYGGLSTWISDLSDDYSNDWVPNVRDGFYARWRDASGELWPLPTADVTAVQERLESRWSPTNLPATQPGGV